LFFAALGLSGVGMSVAGPLAKYQDLFLGLTVVLLGISFYLTYTNPKSSKTNKIILWFSITLVGVLMLYTYRYQLFGGL